MNLKWIAKNFEETIGATILGIVIMVIAFNVIARFCFNTSFNWAEEIATIGYVWIVFIGASACYKRHMHIGIDAIVRLLPKKVARIVVLFTELILIITNIYLTYLSAVFAIAAWKKPTAVLYIPYTFVDISATIGFGLMSFYSIRFFMKDLKNENNL